MGTLDDYQIATRNREVIIGNFARHFVPSPAEDDYKRGYITRYFTKARNNREGVIVEIDKSQFDSHADLSGGLQFNYYVVFSFRWKIIGALEEIQASNFNTVNIAEQKFIGISKKLRNLLQFARLV